MKHINKIRHFTLVEIMTVIVIAAILFAIGIPAFSTMIQGNNMTVAVRQLSAKIQAARAYAVTNRCKVAVVFATNNVKDDYCYSAYRVCIVNDSEDGNKKVKVFQEWIADENWKTLPKGVLRKDTTASYPNNVTIDASDIGGSTTTSFNALVFDKKGQMESSGTINLCQGRYLSGSSHYTERSAEGKVIVQPIEINQYTGKIKTKEITLEDPT